MITPTCRSPIVQMLLELGIGEDEVKVQEMTFQSIKLPDYLAVNPMGTSPAFKDGDLCLYESGAITSYLLETLDKENKLHPALGSPKRALYHQVPTLRYHTCIKYHAPFQSISRFEVLVTLSGIKTPTSCVNIHHSNIPLLGQGLLSCHSSRLSPRHLSP